MSIRITAFGASSSRHSINKKFAAWAASQLPSAEVNLLDLNDFEMPIYSIDRERENGMPELAQTFLDQLAKADALVVSLAEHNGAYSVAFKNVFDWASRIHKNVWMDKPLLLLSTAPGGRGGLTVLEIAVAKFSRMSQGPIVHFSLPFFGKNFEEGEGIIDAELLAAFNEKLKEFQGVFR